MSDANSHSCCYLRPNDAAELLEPKSELALHLQLSGTRTLNVLMRDFNFRILSSSCLDISSACKACIALCFVPRASTSLASFSISLWAWMRTLVRWSELSDALRELLETFFQLFRKHAKICRHGLLQCSDDFLERLNSLMVGGICLFRTVRRAYQQRKGCLTSYISNAA